jgi:RNase adapter protein RapZ
MFTRFVSFGFKFGAPADLDLQFDVRFLENPYFVPELRPLSGREAAVADYVLNQGAAKTFLEHLRGLLTFLVPAYDAEGKSYLTVGLGCTGGRHRSVAIAEALARELKAERGFDISVVHRDVDREHHSS